MQMGFPSTCICLTWRRSPSAAAHPAPQAALHPSSNILRPLRKVAIHTSYHRGALVPCKNEQRCESFSTAVLWQTANIQTWVRICARITKSCWIIFFCFTFREITSNQNKKLNHDPCVSIEEVTIWYTSYVLTSQLNFCHGGFIGYSCY